MSISRRRIQAWACTLALGAALAQASPASPNNAPVKILVGFPAGGVVDLVARAFAAQLKEENGSTVIVENRPGASGKIAIDNLLSASNQGDTLAVIPVSVAVLTPQVMKSANYDAVRDFDMLGILVEYCFAVAAGPAANVGTWQAYKAWAQAHPQRSAYASPGLGTPQQFLGAQLQKALGVELQHVPYKGGAAAINDLLGGQVPLLITTEQLLPAYEAQGKLKTLFVTSHERNPNMPKVPTAAEVGLPGLEASDWFALYAKAGTPPARLAEWRTLVAKIVASPKFVETIRGMGYGVPSAQPADFKRLLREQQEVWAGRVRLAGFKATD
ncbi:MAG: hypothetical protein KGN16_13120 [Burkholderiales bacterium]|nr:hypothetical protein [Burkholderiales bacterium]